MADEPTATALRMLAGLRRMVEDRRPASVIIEAVDVIIDTLDPGRVFVVDVGELNEQVDAFTIDLTAPADDAPWFCPRCGKQGKRFARCLTCGAIVKATRDSCTTCQHWTRDRRDPANGFCDVDQSFTATNETNHCARFVHAQPGQPEPKRTCDNCARSKPAPISAPGHLLCGMDMKARDRTASANAERCPFWRRSDWKPGKCAACVHWKRAGNVSGVCDAFASRATGEDYSCAAWRPRDDASKRTCRSCANWGPAASVGACPDRAFTIDTPGDVACANWKPNTR